MTRIRDKEIRDRTSPLSSGDLSIASCYSRDFVSREIAESESTGALSKVPWHRLFQARSRPSVIRDDFEHGTESCSELAVQDEGQLEDLSELGRGINEEEADALKFLTVFVSRRLL